MTNREKIDYLKQYKHLDEYINQLIEDCARLRSRAEKITPTLTGMPQGGDGENQRELAICRLIDLNNEINEKVDKHVDLGGKIRREIASIDSMNLRVLMYHRYIDGMKWENICVAMGYEWAQIHRMHKEALTLIVIT